MNMKYPEDLIERIQCLCETFQKYSLDVEHKDDKTDIIKELVPLYRQNRKMINISSPHLLMALMDAYEIIRDEEMLQEVLDVVSRGIGELKASPENVQLLSYCYYYVEDDECAEKAKQMLHELAQNFSDGQNSPEFEKTLEIYHEFIGM